MALVPPFIKVDGLVVRLRLRSSAPTAARRAGIRCALDDASGKLGGLAAVLGVLLDADPEMTIQLLEARRPLPMPPELSARPTPATEAAATRETTGQPSYERASSWEALTGRRLDPRDAYHVSAEHLPDPVLALPASTLLELMRRLYQLDEAVGAGRIEPRVNAAHPVPPQRPRKRRGRRPPISVRGGAAGLVPPFLKVDGLVLPLRCAPASEYGPARVFTALDVEAGELGGLQYVLGELLKADPATTLRLLEARQELPMPQALYASLATAHDYKTQESEVERAKYWAGLTGWFPDMGDVYLVGASFLEEPTLAIPARTFLKLMTRLYQLNEDVAAGRIEPRLDDSIAIPRQRPRRRRARPPRWRDPSRSAHRARRAP